jgi:aspartate kinase
MSTAVLKFGGTSVATSDRREQVYEKIEENKNIHDNIVVVVSAQGREGSPYATDTLINLVKTECMSHSERELDMIYSCGEIISASIIASNLIDRGIEAVSLTGGQAGIVTDNNFGDANIYDVDTRNIKRHFNEGKVVVVAGSQGRTIDEEITTLGRGGSDTTAVLLGVNLGADETIIYTDVEGIMTADPRLVEESKVMKSVGFDFCLNYAENGAKVIHDKAVRLAMNNDYENVYIRSTFSQSKGTRIQKDSSENLGFGYDAERERGRIVIGDSELKFKKLLRDIIAKNDGIQVGRHDNIIEFEFYGGERTENIEAIHDGLVKCIFTEGRKNSISKDTD